jgi:hypothetical protein
MSLFQSSSEIEAGRLAQESSYSMEGIRKSDSIVQTTSQSPVRVTDLLQQKLEAQKTIYTEGTGINIQLLVKFIPLRFLDLSSTKMGPSGFVQLLTNLKFLDSTLRVLDVSNNNVGPRPFQAKTKHNKDYKDDEENSLEVDGESSDDDSTKQDIMDIIADHLKSLYLTELRLNNCRLFTKGAIALMKAFSDTSPDTCGATLKMLLLSGNEIYDSFGSSLLSFLHSNAVLEVLDLGFNRFTVQFNDQIRGAYQTTSTTSEEFKLNNLTVNLIGNDCDRLLLDTPALARAKSTNTFRPGQHSSTLSYDHVSINARADYMQRIKLDNQSYARAPRAKINFIA